MRVFLCDICGDRIELSNEMEQEAKRLKNYPKGYFVLDYRQMVLSPKNEPSHFGYSEFNMCDPCNARINKAIFETVAKIRETTYRPTAIIGIKEFPPEPEVMPQTICTCDMTARG